jgi:hypothetical protein
LESNDIKVVYDFDRLNENQPDQYWASAKRLGLQLGFDANQMLNVIFLHVLPSEGYDAVDRSACDIPFFSNVAEVEKHGAREHLRVTTGNAEFLGVQRHWARLEDKRHSLHYEFRDGSLALVTISLAK